jgi:hypothetical protein
MRKRPAPPVRALFVAEPRPLGRLHAFPLEYAGELRQLFSQELSLVFLATHMARFWRSFVFPAALLPHI